MSDKLSLRGCRSVAEALARYEPWLNARLVKQVEDFAATMAEAVMRGEMTAESAEAAIEMAIAGANQSRLEGLRITAEILAEHSTVVH
jgi:hypothetical protein